MQRRITLIQKIRTNQPGEGKFYSVESLGHVQILEQTTLDPYFFVASKRSNEFACVLYETEMDRSVS